MPRPDALARAAALDVAADQDGVISRAQLLAVGLSPAEARRDVDNGRWQRLARGVFLTHSGPVDDRARVWAGVLFAGCGAAASHRTALWLAGALDEALPAVHVCIPAARRVEAYPGLRIHHSRCLDARRHPAARPPRTRLEDAVLDTAEGTAPAADVLNCLFTVTQKRLTTPARLLAALDQRPRHRWRALIRDVLADVVDGVASVLEQRYARDVERRHGLPRGVRNRPEARPGGSGTWYRDVRYTKWNTLVELDGHDAHRGTVAFRDRHRDNAAAVRGETSLRYGWREVAGDACGVALQVGHVLRLNGWPGRLRLCGPGCSVGLAPL